jgi:hypothetical protein
MQHWLTGWLMMKTRQQYTTAFTAFSELKISLQKRNIQTFASNTYCQYIIWHFLQNHLYFEEIRNF